MAKRGRPSAFTPEVVVIICEQLASGMTLREVCRAEDMPHESTVRKWAIEDYEGFYTHYAKAREIGYQIMADELVEIADDGSNDWMERQNKDGSTFTVLNGEHVQRSRLRVDTRKWLLSKALPKLYGDKMGVEHSGEVTQKHEHEHIRDEIARQLNRQTSEEKPGSVARVIN